MDRTDFERFFAPDVVWTTMETGEETHGRQPVRDLMVGLHTQVFDARPELVSMVCDDGIAVIEAVFAGRHTGEFAGLPATERPSASPTPWPTTWRTVLSRHFGRASP